MVDLKDLKVMVIDDSGTITRAAEIYLAGPKDKPTGIITKTVGDGFDAIPEIFKFQPHIIFLDVMMPRVEGFTICKAIKGNPALRGIKVIMLTSKDGLFDRARGADAGADDYISKPFQKDKILAVVAQHAPTVFTSS
jgi:twitching motility two-component system response regulator PilG